MGMNAIHAIKHSRHYHTYKDLKIMRQRF